MKNLKKLVRQALLLLAVFASFALFSTAIHSQKAEAFSSSVLTEQQLEDGLKTLHFENRFTIVGTFNGTGVEFVDNGPHDTDFTYKPQGLFCGGSGIKIPGSQLAFANMGSYKSVTADSVDLKVPSQPTGGASCDYLGTHPFKNVKIGNPNQASIEFTWQGDGTLQPAANANPPGSGSWTFTPISSGNNIYQSDDATCSKKLILKNNSSGVVYDLTKNPSGGLDAHNFPGLDWMNSGQCYVKSVNMFDQDSGQFQNIAKNANFATDGSVPSSTGSATTGGAAATDCGSIATCTQTFQNGDSAACAVSGGWVLEWISCPLTSAIGKFADGINSGVESLLNFNVNGFLPVNGQVNAAWTIFKDIVSGLVVLLLLIMVISQAVGGQFFDAYTVKKMLPRLVIAVILMQFSFTIARWTIGVVNDAGLGIKQLMLLPFGGGGFMDLNSILHHLNPGYAAASNYPLLGLIGVLLFTFRGFIEPILIFIAIGVSSALLTAWATLVFRNIIIIAGVMFSPLALLLWATPGQTMQGYWRKYIDNISKALLLFPMAMALIYIGRIAAWLGGGLGTPGLMDYLLVLIAYFFPYFYLPKAFKWGGQLLAGVNQALNNNKAIAGYKSWGYGIGKKKWQRYQYGGDGGAGLNENEDSLYMNRFNPNSRVNKALSKVGLGRVLTNKAGEGRRNPLSLEGRRVKILRSGRIFENQQNYEEIMAASEKEKHTADEGATTRFKRLGEAARSGLIGAYRFAMGKDGKIDGRGFPKDRDYLSEEAYYAAILPLLNHPDWRVAGAAAKFLTTNPSWAIHSGSRVPMDPTGQLYKKRMALEKKYGLKGKFSYKKMGPRDAELYKRMQGLRDKEENSTLTAAERDDLNELNTLFTLRMGDVRKPTKAEAKQIRKNMKIIKNSFPDLLEEDDNWFSNVDDNGNPVKEDDKSYFLKATHHPEVPKKAISDQEVSQALAGINFMDIAQAFAKYYDMQLDYSTDPNAPIGHGLFNLVDIINYALTDHDAASREASFHESQENNYVYQSKKSKRKFDFGLRGRTNIKGDSPLLPADKRLQWYVNGLERRDGTTSQVLSHKTQTASTKEPFDEWLSETLTPADLPALADHLKGLPPEIRAQKAPIVRRAVEEMYRMRRAVGIADNDARKITSRDLLILQDTPQYRYYDPSWNAQKTREIYDKSVDPEGAKKSVRVDAPDVHALSHDTDFSTPDGNVFDIPPEPEPITPEDLERMGYRGAAAGDRITPEMARAIREVNARTGGYRPEGSTEAPIIGTVEYGPPTQEQAEMQRQLDLRQIQAARQNENARRRSPGGFGQTAPGHQYQGEQIPLGPGETERSFMGGRIRSWSPENEAQNAASTTLSVRSSSTTAPQEVDVDIRPNPIPVPPIGRQDIDVHYSPGGVQGSVGREFNAMPIEPEPGTGEFVVRQRPAARTQSNSPRAARIAGELGIEPAVQRTVIEGQAVTAKERAAAQAYARARQGVDESRNVVNTPTNFGQLDQRTQDVQAAIEQGRPVGEWRQVGANGSRTRNSESFRQMSASQRAKAIERTEQTYPKQETIAPETPQVSTSTEAVPVAPITAAGPAKKTGFDKVETRMGNALRAFHEAERAGDTALQTKLQQRVRRLTGQLNHLYSSRDEGWDHSAERIKMAAALANENAGTELAVPADRGKSKEIAVRQPEVVTSQRVKAPTDIGYGTSDHGDDETPAVLKNTEARASEEEYFRVARNQVRSKISPELETRLKNYKEIKAQQIRGVQDAIDSTEQMSPTDKKLFDERIIPGLKREAAREIRKTVVSGIASTEFGQFDQRAKEVQGAAAQGISPGQWQALSGSGGAGNGSGSPPSSSGSRPGPNQSGGGSNQSNSQNSSSNQFLPGAPAPAPSMNLASLMSKLPSGGGTTQIVHEKVVKEVPAKGQTAAAPLSQPTIPTNGDSRYQGRQGTAEDRWREEQQRQSEMRDALKRAFDPMARELQKSGKKVNTDTLADSAARNIAKNGRL